MRRKLALLRWVREEHLDIKSSELNETYIRSAADGAWACLRPQRRARPRADGAPLIPIARAARRSAPAHTELLKLSKYKAPRDKIICILNCCKIIYSAYRTGHGNAQAPQATGSPRPGDRQGCMWRTGHASSATAEEQPRIRRRRLSSASDSGDHPREPTTARVQRAVHWPLSWPEPTAV